MRRRNPAEELELFELRRSARRRSGLRLAWRIVTAPRLSPIEWHIGRFVEELEPQVRSAVIALHRKGYSIESAGFAGDAWEYQEIRGTFLLDRTIWDRLRKTDPGLDIREYAGSKSTILRFRPEKKTLSAIKKRWDKIVKVLPKGQSWSPPTETPQAERLRWAFGGPKGRFVRPEDRETVGSNDRLTPPEDAALLPLDTGGKLPTRRIRRLGVQLLVYHFLGGDILAALQDVLTHEFERWRVDRVVRIARLRRPLPLKKPPRTVRLS